MGSFRRLRDVGYALFFLFHLAVIVLFNAQLVLDKKLFPKQLIDLKDKYVKDYKDPLFGNTPTWFQTLIWFEMFTYVPFLLIGFFGALAGAQWMRIPSIIYASSVITGVIPMLAHIMYDDFSSPTKIGPKTTDERMYTSIHYGGFLVVISWMLLDQLVCRRYPNIKDVGHTTAYIGGKQKKN